MSGIMMKSIFKGLVIAALFASNSASFAQTAEETTPAPAAEETATSPRVNEPVQENYPTEPVPDQPPTDVVFEVHGDWQVRCAADDAKNCFLYQLGRDENKNPIAEFNLVQLRNEGQAVAGITIVTPLGTNLGRGLKWRIDGGKARTYPYSWCAQVGCFARFGMTNDQIAGMKRGAQGLLALSAIQNPEKEVQLTISLTGFTAAYDTLTEVNAQQNQ